MSRLIQQSSHPGLWLAKYLCCIASRNWFFFWMWRLDCCSSLCLVHRSTRPTVNIMSPKPLFRKQKLAGLFKVGHNCRTQTLYPGRRHIHSYYCVSPKGASMVLHHGLLVSPACRGQWVQQQKELQQLHDNNYKSGMQRSKSGTEKRCLQGQRHHSICHAIWVTSDLWKAQHKKMETK